MLHGRTETEEGSGGQTADRERLEEGEERGRKGEEGE